MVALLSGDWARRGCQSEKRAARGQRADRRSPAMASRARAAVPAARRPLITPAPRSTGYRGAVTLVDDRARPPGRCPGSGRIRRPTHRASARRAIPVEFLPRHVALVMDGNGRWARQRGLPRTEGHRAGEAALLDVLHGAIEIGVTTVSAYAFSTENWRRTPEEVRFLMGFNKEVIRRRRDELGALGVRIRWAGRRPRLWRSVIDQLEDAEELHPRQRPADASVLRQLRRPGRARRRDARHCSRGCGRHDQSGEDRRAHDRRAPRRAGIAGRRPVHPQLGRERTSNFLLWQSAYAELVFDDTPWPEFDRRNLWRACLTYAQRDRRFGGAGPVGQEQPRRSAAVGREWAMPAPVPWLSACRPQRHRRESRETTRLCLPVERDLRRHPVRLGLRPAWRRAEGEHQARVVARHGHLPR